MLRITTSATAARLPGVDLLKGAALRGGAAALAGAAIIAGTVTFAAVASAHDYKVGGVTVDHPWSRATPPGAKVAVGYMRLVNASDEPVTLVGGSADFADIVLHSMEMDGGVMKMADIEGGIEIPAGETVTLEPGGTHVMFTNLEAPFVEGETRTATLDFGEAGTVTVDFAVSAMGATHDHGSMSN